VIPFPRQAPTRSMWSLGAPMPAPSRDSQISGQRAVTGKLRQLAGR
jgi:hypothetical protein